MIKVVSGRAVTPLPHLLPGTGLLPNVLYQKSSLLTAPEIPYLSLVGVLI